MSPFSVPEDEVIQPGTHWFPATRIASRTGGTSIRRIRTARCAETGAAMQGQSSFGPSDSDQGEGGPVVKNVELKWTAR